jgi:hypothetical protein
MAAVLLLLLKCNSHVHSGGQFHGKRIGAWTIQPVQHNWMTPSDAENTSLAGNALTLNMQAPLQLYAPI